MAALHRRLHEKSLRVPKTPTPQVPRRGRVIDAITTVLQRADAPLRARDVHRAAEQLTGGPIKWTSVKATLAAHATGATPRLNRVGHGRYQLVQGDA